MPRLRTGLTAIAAAGLLVGATTVVAGQNGASAAPPAVEGISHMATTAFNLPTDAWTDIPLTVKLPKAGVYEIDANVRGRLQGPGPLNTGITARLWDATSGTAVSRSERVVYQLIDFSSDDGGAGGNQTAPISELVEVSGPTTIQLQALRRDAVGSASIAQIYSDSYGYTSLRYERVSP